MNWHEGHPVGVCRFGGLVGVRKKKCLSKSNSEIYKKKKKKKNKGNKNSEYIYKENSLIRKQKDTKFHKLFLTQQNTQTWTQLIKRLEAQINAKLQEMTKGK